MESLLTGILSKVGDQGIEKIAQSAGVDSSTAQSILSQAGPIILTKIADNTKSKEGLSSLNTALDSHDGSILDNIDDLVNPEVDTKGGKILGHIFGSSAEDLTTVLAKNNNTDSGSTSKLLEMAAPLILGQIGSKKSSSNLDAGGIFDLLQSEKQTLKDSGMLSNIATSLLDKDNDGSVVDDILGMAANFFKK